jgi:hypothetical protein
MRVVGPGGWKDPGSASMVAGRATIMPVNAHAVQIQPGPPSQDTEGEVQGDELAGV